MKRPTLAEFDAACRNVELLVKLEAYDAWRTYGVKLELVECDPHYSLDELRRDFESRKVIRVWTGASSNTIYSTPYGNYRFRFWHDCLHASMRLGFTLADELAVGAWHVRSVARRHGPESLEARIMALETAGQALCHANTGEHIRDQRAWVMATLGFKV